MSGSGCDTLEWHVFGTILVCADAQTHLFLFANDNHLGTNMSGKVLLTLTEKQLTKLLGGNYANALVIQDAISDLRKNNNITKHLTKEDLCIDHVVRGDMIASGNFGSVYRGVWHGSTSVALKSLCGATEEEFFAEAAILKYDTKN